MYCKKCGNEVPENAVFCPRCGTNLFSDAPNNNVNFQNEEYSEKGRLAAFLLCFFFGLIGVHRFYAGKIGTGILYIFTLGLCGIGTIVDMILILTGSFKDKEGKYIREWMY